MLLEYKKKVDKWCFETVKAAFTAKVPVVIPTSTVQLSNNTVKNKLQNIIRHYQWADQLAATLIPEGVQISRLRGLSMSDIKFADGRVGGFTTTVKPTMDHLAAYKTLMNDKVILCVEFIGYSSEQFALDYPMLKAFTTSLTPTGMLLL